MGVSNLWFAGWAAAAALVALPAGAQVKAGSDTGLGLSGADVPQLLKDIKADPYKAPTAPACESIPGELQQISDLIGPDLDAEATPQETSVASKGVAMARGLLPYRGVVRFVTGANKKDQELRDAIVAGYARRGFLRGALLNLKCHAEPAPEPAGTPAAKTRKHTKAAAAG